MTRRQFVLSDPRVLPSLNFGASGLDGTISAIALWTDASNLVLGSGLVSPRAIFGALSHCRFQFIERSLEDAEIVQAQAVGDHRHAVTLLQYP